MLIKGFLGDSILEKLFSTVISSSQPLNEDTDFVAHYEKNSILQ